MIIRERDRSSVKEMKWSNDDLWRKKRLIAHRVFYALCIYFQAASY